MIKNIQSRRGSSEGFTLVELLIVILLIAVLLAFVLPNFFGSREKAGDRVAQQTIKTALTPAKTLAADNEQYPADTAAAVTRLTRAEPNVKFTSGASVKEGNNRTVSVASTARQLRMAAIGENNGCWLVELNLGVNATTNNPLPDRYGFTNQGDCTATNAAFATTGTPNWAPNQSFPSRD